MSAYMPDNDVVRIIRIAREYGHSLTEQQARELWEDYSDGWCAGWLDLPEDDSEVWNIIEGMVKKEE